MKPIIKKIFKITLIVIVILVVAYSIFIGFLLTNGYKDNVSFCSKYQKQIEKYKTNTGKYPNSLKELDKPNSSYRYNELSCGYSTQDGEYKFYTKIGLGGLAFYDSKAGKWTYD